MIHLAKRPANPGFTIADCKFQAQVPDPCLRRDRSIEQRGSEPGVSKNLWRGRQGVSERGGRIVSFRRLTLYPYPLLLALISSFHPLRVHFLEKERKRLLHRLPINTSSALLSINTIFTIIALIL